MTTPFLTIEHGKLVAKSSGTLVIDSLAKLDAVLTLAGEDGVLTSSSIDFPEESTTDVMTLALVGYLHRRAEAPDTM